MSRGWREWVVDQRLLLTGTCALKEKEVEVARLPMHMLRTKHPLACAGTVTFQEPLSTRRHDR